MRRHVWLCVLLCEYLLSRVGREESKGLVMCKHLACARVVESLPRAELKELLMGWRSFLADYLKAEAYNPDTGMVDFLSVCVPENARMNDFPDMALKFCAAAFTAAAHVYYD